MADRPRLALDPPQGSLVLISESMVRAAIEHARSSPRRRVIAPFHKSHADPLQRMLNAVQPDSYVRPHRHLDPPKTEAWLLLRGALAFFTFKDDGRVRDCLRLAAGGEAFGVDLEPGIYHTFIALEPDTVIYEVKLGPYAANDDKAFAPWAPPEGDARVSAYVEQLRGEFARRNP